MKTVFRIALGVFVAGALALAGCASKGTASKGHTTARNNDPEHLHVINLDGTVTSYVWPLTNAVPGIQ